MKLSEHVQLIKVELDQHLHCDSDTKELWRHVFNLEREVTELEAALEAPARLTITSSQNGTHMGSYDLGTTVDLKAVVRNGKNTPIADTLTWSSDQGTVVAGDNGTADDGTVYMTATLINVPSPGTVNVVATTSNGLGFTDAIVFNDPADAVPASIEVTDSVAPAA